MRKRIMFLTLCLIGVAVAIMSCGKVVEEPAGTTTTTSTTTSSAPGSTSTTTTTTTSLPDFNWTEKIASAAFSPRHQHTSVVFDSKMWVIGGQLAGTKTNEVWSSSNGSTWDLATAEAAFAPRSNHSSVVFDSKMWVIGGFTTSRTNEVWFSSNGIDWQLATAEAAFSGRHNHTSVVFNNKMWVIGGASPSLTNEVWSSSDGIDWVMENGNPAFAGRSEHSSVIHDGKMWVIGGYDNTDYQDDVWYSSDGINWIQAGRIQASAPSSVSDVARNFASAVVYEFNGINWMFVMGGSNTYGGGGTKYLNDMWYSNDGTDWTMAPVTTTYPSREAHTSVVFNNKIWVIGGYGTGSTIFNDVWYSPKS